VSGEARTSPPLVLVLVLSLVMLRVGSVSSPEVRSKACSSAKSACWPPIAWMVIPRHRLVRKSPLSGGVVVDARLTRVDRTKNSMNDERIHAITIENPDDGEPLVVKMGSGPAFQAGG